MPDAQTALRSPVMAADIGHQFISDKVHQIPGMSSTPVVTPDGGAVMGQEIILAAVPHHLRAAYTHYNEPFGLVLERRHCGSHEKLLHGLRVRSIDHIKVGGIEITVERRQIDKHFPLEIKVLGVQHQGVDVPCDVNVLLGSLLVAGVRQGSARTEQESD